MKSSLDAERLSAVMDGEGRPGEVEQVCASWRHDARTRADWQAYHLIGDVLRSTDLAQADPTERLLGRVQDALQAEPAWLLPTIDMPATSASPSRASARRLRRWATPVGIAAGIALVFGVTRVTLQSDLPPGGQLAGAPHAFTPALAPVPVSLETPGDSHAAQVRSAAREASLQPYLHAHRLVPGTPVLGVAPGLLRSVAHDSNER